MTADHGTRGRRYSWTRDQSAVPAATGANGPAAHFEMTEQTKAASKAASQAKRDRGPIEFDFDTAIARLKIILAEHYDQ